MTGQDKRELGRISPGLKEASTKAGPRCRLATQAFFEIGRPLAMDVVGSGIDYSKEAKFVETAAKKIYYGPVYIRRESEPYMTLGLASGRSDAGASIIELNLGLMWDIVQQTKVGNRGIAYVVSAEGRTIAHPDLSVGKSLRDVSSLAQVREARMTNWMGTARTARDMNDQDVLTAFARVPSTGEIGARNNK